MFDGNFKHLRPQSTKSLEEYGRFQQHLALLEDRERLRSYSKAIASKVKKRTVLDVGAGTGVLSLIALRAGFNNAILIEPSKKISEYARHFAEINGVSDRVTILNSCIEDININDLPSDIDLVVSENLSSMLFGFGSWDWLVSCTQKLPNAQIIPESGTLYCALSETELSTRGERNGGLKFLSEIGINSDLFGHTFRSGGNIFDKSIVNKRLKTDELIPIEIASFNHCKGHNENKFIKAQHTTSSPKLYNGLVFYWTVCLSSAPKKAYLSSHDEVITSWFPYYIKFIEPKQLDKGSQLNLELILLDIDAPYKYAFQILGDGVPLTQKLFW